MANQAQRQGWRVLRGFAASAWRRCSTVSTEDKRSKKSRAWRCYKKPVAKSNADEISRERKYALLFILAISVLGIFVQKARADTPIYFNDSQAPADISESIEYAAWSWSQRTDISLYYAGKTTISLIQDSVVVAYGTPESFTAAGVNSGVGGYAVRWNHPDGSLYAWQVFLNTSTYEGMNEPNMRTLVHELGHTVGLNHTSDSHSVMSGQQLRSRYSLPMIDYIGMGGSECHAELTRENDIYIPDIEGQRANLKYLGDMTWKLETLSDNAESLGCTSVLVDIDLRLTISDLRGMGVQYRAEFMYVGNDTWKLWSAE